MVYGTRVLSYPIRERRADRQHQKSSFFVSTLVSYDVIYRDEQLRGKPLLAEGGVQRPQNYAEVWGVNLLFFRLQLPEVRHLRVNGKVIERRAEIKIIHQIYSSI